MYVWECPSIYMWRSELKLGVPLYCFPLLFMYWVSLCLSLWTWTSAIYGCSMNPVLSACFCATPIGLKSVCRHSQHYTQALEDRTAGTLPTEPAPNPVGCFFTYQYFGGDLLCTNLKISSLFFNSWIVHYMDINLKPAPFMGIWVFDIFSNCK